MGHIIPIDITEKSVFLKLWNLKAASYFQIYNDRDLACERKVPSMEDFTVFVEV